MSMMKVLCKTCKSEIWVDAKADEICNSCKAKAELSPNPWKEGLMIFQNAIQIMKPRDSFKTNREVLTMIKHDGMHVFRSNRHAGLVFVEPDLLKTKGQIIPAEPKVLTFREWYFGFDEKKNSRTKQDIEEGFNSGDENGQLREWLRHKELRKMVEDFNRCDLKLLWPSNINEYQDRFKTLLDKLKEAK